MVSDNEQLMQKAWYSLTDRWNTAALASLVFVLLVGGIGFIPGPGTVVGWVIGGPMSLGLATFILGYYRRLPDMKVETIFTGFNAFLNAFVAYLLMFVFILLWALLLIVPGIVAAYSYRLTYFILSDNPGMSGSDAIKESKRMMDGYKAKMFFLDLRFIGWFLLCLVTAGIALLWVVPYHQTAVAAFYEEVKQPVDVYGHNQFAQP